MTKLDPPNHYQLHPKLKALFELTAPRILAVGDVLEVKHTERPELTVEYDVVTPGMYQLPPIGDFDEMVRYLDSLSGLVRLPYWSAG